MAIILSEGFTVPGDFTGESPRYSSWAEVGSATALTAEVVVSNNYSPDIWLQWADDTDNPDEPVDVFLPGAGPNGWYQVHANDLTPAGGFVRVKVIAWDMQAPCHVTFDTAE